MRQTQRTKSGLDGRGPGTASSDAFFASSQLRRWGAQGLWGEGSEREVLPPSPWLVLACAQALGSSVEQGGRLLRGFSKLSLRWVVGASELHPRPAGSSLSQALQTACTGLGPRNLYSAALFLGPTVDTPVLY